MPRWWALSSTRSAQNAATRMDTGGPGTTSAVPRTRVSRLQTAVAGGDAPEPNREPHLPPGSRRLTTSLDAEDAVRHYPSGVPCGSAVRLSLASALTTSRSVEARCSRLVGSRGGAQTCEIGGCTGRRSASPCARRSSCSFGDVNGRSHVEYKNLSRASGRTSLDDQLYCLFRRHEVARYFRVGDRHRATIGDLRTKCFDHRAAAAEHVTESDTQIRPIMFFCGKRSNTLGDPFRVPEYADWIRGLVRRHVDKPLCADLVGSVQHVLRSIHVGLHRFLTVQR